MVGVDVSAVRIATAIPEDVPAIALLLEETWCATYPSAAEGITHEDVAAYARKFTDPEHLTVLRAMIDDQRESRQFFVARNERDEIVGYCRAMHAKNGHDRVRAIYVRRDYWQNGVGAQLMTAALTWLGGEREVWIDCVRYNHRAIAFYKKFGFIMQGPIDFTLKLASGREIHEVRLIKPPTR